MLDLDQVLPGHHVPGVATVAAGGLRVHLWLEHPGVEGGAHLDVGGLRRVQALQSDGGAGDGHAGVGVEDDAAGVDEEDARHLAAVVVLTVAIGVQAHGHAGHGLTWPFKGRSVGELPFGPGAAGHVRHQPLDHGRHTVDLGDGDLDALTAVTVFVTVMDQPRIPAVVPSGMDHGTPVSIVTSGGGGPPTQPGSAASTRVSRSLSTVSVQVPAMERAPAC